MTVKDNNHHNGDDNHNDPVGIRDQGMRAWQWLKRETLG